MFKFNKKWLSSLIGASCIGVLSAPAYSANWLMLQGTEKEGEAPRANVWGFVQPEVQTNSDTKLKAGAFAGQKAVFNQIGPDLKTNEQFNIRRARIGVRGTGFPLDSKVNYFLLTEFGNNAITRQGGGSAKITDASVTLNHIPGARIRFGTFKTPTAEEGLQAIHTFDYINFTNMTNQLLLERFFEGDGSTTAGNGTGTCAGGTPNPACANNPIGPVGAFRDTGIQVFDAFGDDNFEFSYALMYGNGHGISWGDDDDNKDTYAYLSAEWIFGGQGPRREGLKVFGWSQNGKRTLTGTTAVGGTGGAGEYDRKRSGAGVTFRKGSQRAAFEYVKADGMLFNGTDGGAVPGSTNNPGTGTASWNVAVNGEADGWYAHYGWAFNPKFELDVRYDILNRCTNCGTGERKIETWTAGLQWMMNKKSRVVLNYEFRDQESPNEAATAPANQILSGTEDRVSLQMLAIF